MEERQIDGDESTTTNVEASELNDGNGVESSEDTVEANDNLGDLEKRGAKRMRSEDDDEEESQQKKPRLSEPSNQNISTEGEMNIDFNQEIIPQHHSFESTTDSDYTKKKKEYISSTTPVSDDEDEDLLVSGWFYQDTEGEKQGPYSTKEMKEWFIAGFFDFYTYVRRVSEDDFKTMAEYQMFIDLTDRRNVAMQQSYVQSSYQYYQPAHQFHQTDNNVEQKGFFNLLNGKFSSNTSSTHWDKKGLSNDRAGRQLNHYFDTEAYQDQMRDATNEPKKKKKISKKMIKQYKKKKEDKKRRRALMM